MQQIRFRAIRRSQAKRAIGSLIDKVVDVVQGIEVHLLHYVLRLEPLP
jgi:hypothetical protein